jgi:hypothetical protein
MAYANIAPTQLSDPNAYDALKTQGTLNSIVVFFRWSGMILFGFLALKGWFQKESTSELL